MKKKSHTKQLLIKIIRYINSKPRGKEISKDICASIRAGEFDSTESLLLGEELIQEID